MLFFYDSTGKRVGFANGDTLYYYLYNVQGDVIAIMRAATGQVVARYSYDAWGKCTVTNASGYTVGEKNPFRYRGYYYDTETGLYYLNSRYYNPEFGRFISADGQLNKTGLAETNLFAYCDNNPIKRADQSGNIWHIAVGALVGGLFGGITQAVSNLIQGKSATDGLLTSVVSGAASGALAASGAGLFTVIAGSAAIGMAENRGSTIMRCKLSGMESIQGLIIFLVHQYLNYSIKKARKRENKTKKRRTMSASSCAVKISRWTSFL